MSQETSTWLNNNTLIGHTAKRGSAWHYRAVEQGGESNHYENGIPVEDVERRLFHWKPTVADVTATYADDWGVTSIRADDRVAICRPAGTFGDKDPGDILGLFKRDSYRVHPYGEWLIENVSKMLDAELSIGSAGLLRKGGVAWVQIELADTITAAEGVQFRPFLTAATSCDGSLATTYQTGAQVVVCDNTLSMALAGADQKVKIRHSVNSLSRAGEVRDALGIVHSTADEFGRGVERLLNTAVTDNQLSEFLDVIAPLAAEGSAPTAKGRAEARRNKYELMWFSDPRVAPWKNTAWGALQLVNTYQHHELSIGKGKSRADRNADRTISGEWQKIDQKALATLARVGVSV